VATPRNAIVTNARAAASRFRAALMADPPWILGGTARQELGGGRAAAMSRCGAVDL
jgi:hypothetical protein